MLTYRRGLSSRGDGETYALSALYGQNFDEDRGNFTVAVDISRKEELLYGDRDFARNNGLAAGLEWSNPDLFFQRGEIGAATPNFAQFYDPNTTGRFPYGFGIPTQQDFIDDYTAEFGAAPTLTSAEQQLLNRGRWRTDQWTSGWPELFHQFAKGRNRTG